MDETIVFKIQYPRMIKLSCKYNVINKKDKNKEVYQNNDKSISFQLDTDIYSRVLGQIDSFCC